MVIGGEDDARDRDGRQPRLTGGLDAAMLRSRTAAWRRLAATTQDKVAANLEAWGDCWVAWSGGKDSTVACDLAVRAWPRIPVVHLDSGLDFPENLAYMADLAAARGWRHETVRCGDGLAAMKAVGTWAHDDPEGASGALAEYWRVIMAGPSAIAQEKFGDRMLTGLRAEESAKRARSLNRAAGHATLPGGLRAWSPIGHWAAADVWAYHCAHAIPENPVYTRLRQMGAPERALRLGFAAGAEGAGGGRIMWLKRGWPDLFERYAAVLPRLRELA